MESRAFIKHAAALSAKIKQSVDEQKPEVQKELNQLFSGLQNPTLPSATRLKELAVSNGFTLDGKVLNRLQQGEGMWS